MLRYYQKDCVKACLNASGGLSILPTGSGKSHIIAELCYQWQNKSVLVVTPRIELVKQNQSKIKSGALCTTINTAYRRKMSSDVLIIDECHLVRKFDGMYREVMSRSNAIYGFTATPYRLDSGHLVPSVFDNVIYEIGRDDLIAKGFLTPRRLVNIPHDTLLNVKNSSFNNVSKMSKDVCPKTKRCVDYFMPKIKGPALIFACDITHAKKIQTMISDSHIIHGELNKVERAKIIDDFKTAKYQCLINCQILTTGFDYPNLRHVIILRPTNSYALYEQICGRGDRIHDGKRYNNIWDFTIASFVFNYSKGGKPDFDKYCIFCMEITDYRLKTCKHCGKALVKGDVPKKTCKQCGHKNFNCATYCKECGEFIRINVLSLRFDLVTYRDGNMLINDKKFYTSRAKAQIFCNELGGNLNNKLGGFYRLYYKKDAYSGRNKILEVR